jgi:hypothetical protein
MDPNQLSSLDPKLREAYERVMSANAAAPAAQPAAPAPQGTQPAPQAPVSTTPQTTTPGPEHHDPLDAMAHASSRFVGGAPAPVEAPAAPAAPTQMQGEPPAAPMPSLAQPVEAPSPVVAPVTPPAVPVAPQAMQGVANEQVHAYVAEEVAGVKSSLKFIQIMYIVGGAVFFIVYALFWMKFFNVASPV